MSSNKKKSYQKKYCYGVQGKHQLLIICPHAYLGTKFIHQFPEIKQAIRITNEQFNRYLAIEQDFATEDLAKNIGEICNKDYDINVKILIPKFPRSIIDAGRIYPYNLRNIIDYDYYPQLKKTLLKIHSNYVKALSSELNLINKNNGYIIDLHTMSSFSPVSRGEKETYSEAVLESPNNLLNYIQSYETCHIFGSKREIEIFTGDWKRNISAYHPLLMSIYESFLLSGHKVEFDKPYVAASHLMGTHLMNKCHSICIDIPKDKISKYTTKDLNYNLSNLEIDTHKLTSIARVISHGIAQIVKGDKNDLYNF